MSTDDPRFQTTVATWKLVALGAFQSVVAFGIWGGLLFWSAGDWHWKRGWLHLALWGLTFAVNLVVLLLKNRAVLEARLKRGKFTERFDVILMGLFVPVMLAIPVAAGYDGAREQMWTLRGTGAVALGIMLHSLGDALTLWSLIVNPYLEKTVRIQSELGHQVITTGPYAIIRHPMYLGVLVMFAGFPFVLGSLLSVVPIAVMTILLVIRTVYEDRLLHEGLAGYPDYARQTRYRLIPGLW